MVWDRSFVPGWLVVPLRRWWGALAAWAILGSAYLMEPLLTLGPGVAVLLDISISLPGLVLVVGVVLVVVALVRLALAGLRRLRGSLASGR